jgi:hypothetical protein
MTSIPVASSLLAGSLLTILLPLAVFLALMVWYLAFVKTVPETVDRSDVEPVASAPTTAVPPQGEHS